MPRLNEPLQRYGSAQPLPAARELRAGPLALLLEGSDLRYIRLGEREIVRRLYVAVRDHNWDTIPQQISNLQIDAAAHSFQVSFDASQVGGDAAFAWHGTISGTADGSITYTMDGAPQRVFRRNRIGLCILYPVRELAGSDCQIAHVDGSREASRFPLQIGPQLVVDGLICPVAPFANMRGIDHEVVPAVSAEARFEGDIFELEDQRNWTDASYKIYSTPLSLPFPVTVGPDTPIRQSFQLRLRAEPGALRSFSHAPQSVAPVSFSLSNEACDLPKLGLGMASHGQLLSAREIARLRALRLTHLRVDLDLASSAYHASLRLAAQQAAELGLGLEIALFLTDEAAQELAALCAQLAEQRLAVARWLVFHKGEQATSPQWIELARRALAEYAPGVPIGGGSNSYFTEINRTRPPVDPADLIAYSINPQVHAFDNRSLVETLAAQAATVASARQLWAGRPLAISPVTLRPRFNPNATGPEPEPQPGELPPTVDLRQLALLGAGWTLGSIKYLAEAGASSITYYETTGWRGVMEQESGPALPEAFPSEPGQLFPLYHVFAAVGAFAGGVVRPSVSSKPLAVDGLVLEAGGRMRVLLANFDAQPQAVQLRGLTGTAATLRLLDDSGYLAAAQDATALTEQQGERRQVAGGELSLDLPPFGLACIDLEAA